MNWNNISVKQYQEIYPIVIDEKWTDLDKLVKIICIITGKTEDEIDSWKLSDINDYRFVFEMDIPEKPRRRIKANGKWYRFEYRIQNMPAARYIEGKTFASDGLIENMHRLMASCVIPQKKIGFLTLIRNIKHQSMKSMLTIFYMHLFSSCILHVFFFAKY